MRGEIERRSNSTERERGVQDLPLETFYLPPEDGSGLPEGYELDTVIGEDDTPEAGYESLPPFLYKGYVYMSPDGGDPPRREYRRSVRINQYLPSPEEPFRGCEEDAGGEEYPEDGRSVRVLRGDSPPVDLMVSVLMNGVSVEATAEIGDYDEFDARAVARAFGPIPKREFVEQAGERGCFEFRSVTVSDGKLVNQLPSCR